MQYYLLYFLLVLHAAVNYTPLHVSNMQQYFQLYCLSSLILHYTPMHFLFLINSTINNISYIPLFLPSLHLQFSIALLTSYMPQCFLYSTLYITSEHTTWILSMIHLQLLPVYLVHLIPTYLQMHYYPCTLSSDLSASLHIPYIQQYYLYAYITIECSTLCAYTFPCRVPMIFPLQLLILLMFHNSHLSDDLSTSQ